MNDPPPTSRLPGASKTTGDKPTTAVAARRAAKQEVGSCSQKERAALATMKAEALAARQMRKRSGFAGTPGRKKRARLAAEIDNLYELDLPPLDPGVDVTSCTVLDEAEMLVDNTYQTLATNWHPPDVTVSMPELQLDNFTVEVWEVVVKKQSGVDFIMDEKTVLIARQKVLKKEDAMRNVNDVDAGEECRIAIKVIRHNILGEQLLVIKTLQAMGALHVAASRLQDIRIAVVWLPDAATKSTSRTPCFLGDARLSSGEMGTALMRIMLSCAPGALVWRVGARETGALDKDVCVPARFVVGNIAESSVVNDIITVNSLILCASASPRATRCMSSRPPHLGASYLQKRTMWRS